LGENAEYDEDGVSMKLRNVDILPQHYMDSQARRPWHSNIWW